MIDVARYEKQHVESDLRIHRYLRKDYISLQVITMMVVVTLFYGLILAGVAAFNLDIIIQLADTNQVILPSIVIFLIYLTLILAYGIFAKHRAEREYDEVDERIQEYDQNLERLEKLYEEERARDVRPSIALEEEEDGEVNLI